MARTADLRFHCRSLVRDARTLLFAVYLAGILKGAVSQAQDMLIAPGQHDFLVTIEKMNAFIRPAGISVPIADPTLLADPTTVPSDPLRAPEMGTRKPMTSPQ
jgi:hypothetical protein